MRKVELSAVTLPLFKEVIIYDSMLRIKSNAGRAPILRHESRTKEQSIAN